jgi:hypothetical protein
MFNRKYFCVQSHTSNYRIDDAESGSVHTNLGANSEVAMSLPSTGPSADDPALDGCHFIFSVEENEGLFIVPDQLHSIKDIITGWEYGKKGRAIYSSVKGSSIELMRDQDGDWIVVSKCGPWKGRVGTGGWWEPDYGWGYVSVCATRLPEDPTGYSFRVFAGYTLNETSSGGITVFKYNAMSGQFTVECEYELASVYNMDCIGNTVVASAGREHGTEGLYLLKYNPPPPNFTVQGSFTIQDFIEYGNQPGEILMVYGVQTVGPYGEDGLRDTATSKVYVAASAMQPVGGMRRYSVAGGSFSLEAKNSDNNFDSAWNAFWVGENNIFTTEEWQPTQAFDRESLFFQSAITSEPAGGWWDYGGVSSHKNEVFIFDWDWNRITAYEYNNGSWGSDISHLDLDGVPSSISSHWDCPLLSSTRIYVGTTKRFYVIVFDGSTFKVGYKSPVYPDPGETWGTVKDIYEVNNTNLQDNADNAPIQQPILEDYDNFVFCACGNRGIRVYYDGIIFWA